MSRCISLLAALVLLSFSATLAAGATATGDDDPVYIPSYKYPVLEEIRERRDTIAAQRDSIQAAVDQRYAEQAEAADEAEKDLRLDWSGIKVPANPDAFDQVWHTPPIPQYYTGSCWAFCSVSLMESEAKRLHDVECKLSEMWVVYWEFVEKAMYYLQEFGHSTLAQGSQDHGTTEVYKQYGAVPAAAYSGVLTEDGRHDHTPLLNELKGYVDWVIKSGSWDPDQNLLVIRSILDKHMGRPPETVEYAGKTYTPQTFLSDVLQLDMDDYVNCVSRLNDPFHTWVLLDVEDNWRRRDDYYNLPLDTFYKVIKEALGDGYSFTLGGDVSEPGRDAMQDAVVVPSWDIPSKYINQASREFRIVNQTTTDDHGIHIVGYTRHGGRDWFLDKDSNRSSRLGKFKGNFFFDGDYIKLKMLAFMIHKDRLQGIIAE